ncbi:hypothetical protein CCACVL1_01189 [Corchorus capsularis]|uniref:Uncharacterized protein n=1 Tax=Corchorus capsularis TaxID=210143 RepID=A0A1R3KLH1_COCAP|nr:hypothetical protein CCACVL1_01189 [Corchorus capsularis]
MASGAGSDESAAIYLQPSD